LLSLLIIKYTVISYIARKEIGDLSYFSYGQVDDEIILYRRTFETERPKGASFQNVGGNLVANLNGVPFLPVTDLKPHPVGVLVPNL
jgi:hypothetical protein